MLGATNRQEVTDEASQFDQTQTEEEREVRIQLSDEVTAV